MRRTLQASVLSRLERAPESPAITFIDDRGAYQWSTASQFFDQAAAYATFLSESGLKKGSVCVVVLSSGEVSAKIVLACVLLGAVPLLVAPPSLQTAGAFSSLSQILQSVVRRTRPELVVLEDPLFATQKELATFEGSTATVIAASQIDASGPAWRLSSSVDESDVAALQLTSGTTGIPKVCMWRHAPVVAALEGMADAMRLTAQDICLNWTPLYHDMGLVNNFFLCLATGAPLGMLRPQDFVKDPSLWLRALASLRATVTWSPNFGFALTAQRCRAENLQDVNLSHVRGFWSAAERIHYQTMLAFHERFKSLGVRLEALKTNFGCAENVGGATFSDPDGPFVFERLDRTAFLRDRIAQPVEETASESSQIVVVGAGKGHSKLQLRILSDERQPLPDGHIGQIALVTPSRMEGYLGDPGATADAVVDDMLVTGDLGYLRGAELFWVGRVHERINVRGVKMDPSDFEAILLGVDGLRPGCFGAFGLDDPVKGTQKIAIVTEVRRTYEGASEDLAADIRNQVFTALGVNVDEVVLVLEGTLTKTSSGKRRHRYVRELYESGQLTAHVWTRPVPGSVRG